MSAGLYNFIQREYLNPTGERQRTWKFPATYALREDAHNNMKGYFVGYEPETELASFHDYEIKGTNIRIYLNRRGIRRRLFRTAHYPPLLNHRYVLVGKRTFRYMELQDVQDYAFEFLNTREGLTREEYTDQMMREDLETSTAFAPIHI